MRQQNLFEHVENLTINQTTPPDPIFQDYNQKSEPGPNLRIQPACYEKLKSKCYDFKTSISDFIKVGIEMVNLYYQYRHVLLNPSDYEDVVSMLNILSKRKR